MKILKVTGAGKLAVGEYTPDDLKAAGITPRDSAEMVSRGRAEWSFSNLAEDSKAAKKAPAEVVPRASAVKKTQAPGDE
ncbi:hypothetical protein SAMN03080615_01664 [Amphritea atlantica]|uniref:Uncharacterized protein n=1 Tax=Amphritea atlantica TaxID=355243 RepID=A0A1H9GGB9_9GAMM|nr:hypothetical protein [Amphritea atlantica]SEQ49083.1 hypothetical protein SAMN03080615_01664 [Amphritea atlantica]